MLTSASPALVPAVSLENAYPVVFVNPAEIIVPRVVWKETGVPGNTGFENLS
jgi:hypothetical protein